MKSIGERLAELEKRMAALEEATQPKTIGQMRVQLDGHEIYKAVSASARSGAKSNRIPYAKITYVDEAACDILDVLEKWGVTVASIDRVFAQAKFLAEFYTPVSSLPESVGPHR